RSSLKTVISTAVEEARSGPRWVWGPVNFCAAWDPNARRAVWSLSRLRLALAASGNHEPGSNHQQDRTDRGRDLFAAMGLNANIDVACLDAMIFRMRNGHEKRQDPQDNHRKPHQK